MKSSRGWMSCPNSIQTTSEVHIESERKRWRSRKPVAWTWTHYKNKADKDFHFKLDENISSKHNSDIFSRVCNDIDDFYKGQCPWTLAQLRESSITYFKSLIDDKRRKSKRMSEEHKQMCRRQGRMREKLAKRKSALEKVDWNEKTKADIAKVLTPDYTSSDESEYESCEEDNNTRYLARYQVKSLTWQRTRLTNVKNALDKIYFKSLSRRTLGMVVPRRRGALQSTREIPEDEVSWAVRRPALSTLSLSDNSLPPPTKTSTPCQK